LPLSLLLTAPVKDAVAGKVTDPHTLKDAPWLIRKWAISTLPSVASLRALRMLAKDSKATKPFIGIGDPQLTDQPIDKAPRRDTANFKLAALYRGSLANVTQLKALPSLPDTAFELRRIAGYLGAGPDALLLRDNATETRVKAARLFDARVVAFSTHGILGGELTGMAEPALVLTPPARATELDDGLLTSSEIAQLKLDADLVILSACNTAGSDGSPGAEGLSGLARAFIYAGARNLLVSHWPVSSGAATMLTTRMMQESTKPHVRFAEAHRRAMVAFLDETDNSDLSRNENAMKSHPAYWAPFSLVGD